MAFSYITMPIITKLASNYYIETIICSMVLNNAKSNKEY